MSLASAACSEERTGSEPLGPGVLDLTVGPADEIAGHYDRNGVVYDVLLESVGGSHRVSLIEGGTVLIALDATESEDGMHGVLDWSAMDVDVDELMELRPVFIDLATAAETWGTADGRDAPDWVVPALQLPAMLVALTEDHGPDEFPEDPDNNPSFGGIP